MIEAQKEMTKKIKSLDKGWGRFPSIKLPPSFKCQNLRSVMGTGILWNTKDDFVIN